ncbi:MAG: transcription antitermination protein NusB, partial [Clostridia bacterium]|nr:transcription antitermination protein NusB [Clostridia bacterium]
RQFNTDESENLMKKVFKQFALDEEDCKFAISLISAVEKNFAELIAGIEEACHHYRADRINPMDKTILLIAMAEIKYFDEIPPVVSVSEAAGLARKYSTDTSADFVNGVLAGVINK